MKIVNVIYDDHPLSLNAKDALFFDDSWDVRQLKVDPEDLEKNADDFSSLEGLVVSVLSPRAFSLYRAALYQLIKLNEKIHFEDYSTTSNKIHKASFVGFNTKIADGVKVGLMSYIGCNSVISPNVIVGNYCWIGNNVFIAPGVKIADNVTIHDNTVISAGAKISKYNEIRKDVAENLNLLNKTIDTDFYGATALYSGI